MSLEHELAGIAGKVAFKIKAAGSSLCSKQAFNIIREAIEDATEVVRQLPVDPAAKRKFLEDAAATALDSLWAVPFPSPLNWLQLAWITKRVRPAALWAIDALIDDACDDLGIVVPVPVAVTADRPPGNDLPPPAVKT